MSRRHAVGLDGLFGGIDVEERVDGHGRPRGDADAVTRDPLVDLAQAFA